MRVWDISFGDVREVLTSERSFLAGESERVFETPIGKLGVSVIPVLRMLLKAIVIVIFDKYNVIWDFLIMVGKVSADNKNLY